MAEIVTEQTIELNASFAARDEAIRRAGELLVANGNVDEAYIDSMFEREQSVSTYMGNGVAIPHGTNESKDSVLSSGMSIITVPEGVDFGGGNIARLVIGIAGKGGEHLDILSSIAIVVSEEENVEKIVASSSKEELMAHFDEVE